MSVGYIRVITLGKHYLIVLEACVTLECLHNASGSVYVCLHMYMISMYSYAVAVSSARILMFKMRCI